MLLLLFSDSGSPGDFGYGAQPGFYDFFPGQPPPPDAMGYHGVSLGQPPPPPPPNSMEQPLSAVPGQGKKNYYLFLLLYS